MRSLALFVLLALVAACTTTKYVPVESVRIDSVYVRQIQRDSIFERDSVYVLVKADTVFYTKTQYRYRDRIVRDTVSVFRCDTITKVVEVEKKLSRIERLKMNAGGGVIWAIPILIALYILYRRFKK